MAASWHLIKNWIFKVEQTASYEIGPKNTTNPPPYHLAPLCKAKSSLKSRQVKSSASQQMQIRGSRSITTLLNKLHANFCLPARSDLLPRLSEACLCECAAQQLSRFMGRQKDSLTKVFIVVQLRCPKSTNLENSNCTSHRHNFDCVQESRVWVWTIIS